MLTVLKFGGSSLADRERIRTAARRIAGAAQMGQAVAVVSAQADTTDDLLAAARKIASGSNQREMDAYLSFLLTILLW